MLENPITSTPLPRQSIGGISKSLSRRSLISLARNAGTPGIEDYNDDDAERSSLVASEQAVATSTPQSPRSSSLSTMSSTPQQEHFQGCLKLYAENKINKSNAWNLQLIDFMTSMLRRHDSRMENLQTASTVVDASARIYSFRVDAVHYEVLKMAGGLCKASHNKRGKKDDDDEGCEDEGAAATDGDGGPAPAKKKRKRGKGSIATNLNTLDGDYELCDNIDPFFERLSATQGDVTACNRAFNASLSIDDDTYSLVLSTDIQFLEEIKENEPEDLELSSHISLGVSLFPPFSKHEHICEPFTGFSISNWDPDTEDAGNHYVNLEESRLNLSQQALVFDMNAEVEPIQVEAHNDLYDDEPLAGIESDEEADVAVAACVARLPPAPVARLTDMRPNAPQDNRLEYSYCGAIVTAWAGPSHWRLKNNRASKMTERTQTTATGRFTVDGTAKKPPRTKKQLAFLDAGLGFDFRIDGQTGDYEPAQPAKISISRKTLATGHTWNEANYKTPIDRGLDESHFRKLFLRRNVMLMRKRDLEASKQAQQPPDPVEVEAARDYDYNNENDASYCVTNAADADEWGNEHLASDPHAQLPAPGATNDPEQIGADDMLEPPTKIAKIFIPYAMRAKKVDMKQLKHCTWKILTENSSDSSEPVVQPTTFLKLYSQLPNRLTPNARESLSVPLALLSILHLTNEKGLILEQENGNRRNFNIVGQIKH